MNEADNMQVSMDFENSRVVHLDDSEDDISDVDSDEELNDEQNYQYKKLWK